MEIERLISIGVFLSVIAGVKEYGEHLNRYNVVYLEITSFISATRRQGVSFREVPNRIVEAIQSQLVSEGFDAMPGRTLTDNLAYIAGKPDGKKFIFIIDEWDAMIREAKDDEIAQKRYLNLLREWFKNSTFTPKAVGALMLKSIQWDLPMISPLLKGKTMF